MLFNISTAHWGELKQSLNSWWKIPHTAFSSRVSICLIMMIFWAKQKWIIWHKAAFYNRTFHNTILSFNDSNQSRNNTERLYFMRSGVRNARVLCCRNKNMFSFSYASEGFYNLLPPQKNNKKLLINSHTMAECFLASSDVSLRWEKSFSSGALRLILLKTNNDVHSQTQHLLNIPLDTHPLLHKTHK